MSDRHGIRFSLDHTKVDENCRRKITECLLNLGTDYGENISRITALAGELTNAACAFYNRLHKDLLASPGMWCAPPEFKHAEKPEGQISYDLISSDKKDVFIFRDLPSTGYANSDPNVLSCGWQTYVGVAVENGRETVGALGVFLQDDFIPSDGDRQTLEIMASVIGREEKRKLADKALRESEEKFRLISDQSLMGIHIIQKGRIVYINQASSDILEYSKEEVLDWKPNEFAKVVHPDDQAFVMEQAKKKQAGDQSATVSYHWRLLSKSGAIKWVESWSKPIEFNDGVADFVMMIDISERKKAEKALRESEAKYRKLLSEIRDGFYLHDKQGVFVYVNQALANIMGFDTPKKLIGTSLLDKLDPQIKNQVTAVFRSAMENGDMPENLELPIVTPDGEIRYIAMQPTLIYEDGQIVGAKGVVLDVTDKRATEEERLRLEEQLRQSQKMEAIGRLAGGVAHDFNNILTGITGYTEMILAAMEPGNPIFADMEEVRKAAERASSLTSQLLAFSRKQIIDPKIINPNDILDHSGRMLERIIGEDIELVFQPGQDICSIKIDPAQLDQIFVNLAVNARDAMPTGGRLSIKTENMTLGSEPIFEEEEGVSGDFVLLAVSDFGHGMDQETIKHIFEPFFSTKEKDKGTGLGLATVYGIVKQNHGFINVYSELEFGTTFKIYFPAIKKDKAELATAKRVVNASGFETVLVVEDEEMVRKLAEKILQKHGYDVIVAQNGLHALEVVKNHPGKIDMLLSDVIMPAMNGWELYQELLKILPGLKVLFMSGYTDDVIAHHGVLEEDTSFIHKPFTIASLTQKVREVLDDKGWKPI